MRDARLDFIKFIALLAVVLGHISNPFSSYIYLWHMPLFFFVSGFFLNISKPLNDVIKKDISRLLMPYFIFSFLGIAIEFIKRFFLGRDIEPFSQVFKSTFIYIDSTEIHHYGFVLWFLPALFFGKIISGFLLRKNHSFSVFYGFALFFAALFIPKMDGNLLPFALQQAFLSVVFILIGFFIRNIELKGARVFYVLSIWMIISLFLMMKYNLPLVDYGALRINNPLLALNFALLICVLILYISEILKERLNFFVYCSNFFMIVFILHPYTNNVADLIINKFISASPLKFLLIFILSFVLMSPLMWAKVRYKNLWIFKYV